MKAISNIVAAILPTLAATAPERVAPDAVHVRIDHCDGRGGRDHRFRWRVPCSTYSFPDWCR